MERCLCCNGRMRGALVCPRCKTDFSAGKQAEKVAEQFFAAAIDFWMVQQTEQCLEALTHSLQLKQSRLVATFRDFVVNQQCKQVLALLDQEKIVHAKRQLFEMRGMFDHVHQLRQLNEFTDYLLLKEFQHNNAGTLWQSVTSLILKSKNSLKNLKI